MLRYILNANGSIMQETAYTWIMGVLLSIPVCYYSALAMYNLTMHSLAKYPGPRIAAITRLWYVHHLVSGTFVQAVFEAHEKYGPVVRIAPDEVIFTSSEAWEDIYGFRHGKPEMGKDTPLYRNPTAPHTISTAGQELHRLYRRLLSRGFSDSALREQEPIIQGKINILMTKLHEHAAKGVMCEMTSWYNFATFDVIGELAFGESFGCLENANYHPWVKMIFEVIKFGGIMQAFGYYPRLFRILIKFVPKTLKEKFASHDKLTREKVQRRLEKTVSYKDLTSRLFEPQYNLQRYQIENNCSTIIIGGSETTATVLSAVTYYLTQNPDVKAKVIREVRGAFSSSNDINAMSTGRLGYLQACLTEALRKFPPAPGVFSRRVPKGGDFIANNWIPEGMQVGISIFCANNSKANFKDPEIFAPGRWIDDPAYRSDDRRAMQAFSYGPRNCIGHNLAKMEMRLVLTRFIWEFDWEIDAGSNDWDKTLVFQTWAKKPLKILLKPVTRYR